ncbi:uracil-DNA glycosylase-like [Adelges cooleyi]|uniref:uracil-DNA glycosylase-like n=1 Tax=Adelges cooleyi TaxID=133065 RepID=UPI00218020ED|nr:uracil-DNA glycosylase-like [Adelges cooleyi]XP_050425791.1 uracil-DNA glycosylase-like [Adelges cooleyi]XP_050425792.1 uracil-DNA glycosylase-like [Adelges cooleyi]XP_050425793.1 uracil-DNA glycosylase-like [Adelges cooleyi]XP_050425794.1 uracil-DNA glycosylase-like [Adelges cooleyi]
MAHNDKDMVYFARKYPFLFGNEGNVEKTWFEEVLKPIFIANEIGDINVLEDINNKLQELMGKVPSGVSPDTPEKIWSFTHRTPLKEIKVVIIGKDPYPTKYQGNPNEFKSDGLAFSTEISDEDRVKVLRDMPRNRILSLRIFDTIKQQFPDKEMDSPRSCWTLDSWARQGVLLFNTALTCGEDSGSHLEWWKKITLAIVIAVRDYVQKNDNKEQKLIVHLWGDDAIVNFYSNYFYSDRCKHVDVTLSRHPSAAYGGRPCIIKNEVFKKTNEKLKEMGKPEIDWSTGPGKHAVQPSDFGSVATDETKNNL